MTFSSNLCIFTIFIVFVSLQETYSENKYSEKVNSAHTKHFVDEPNVNMRQIDKPFRMAKLNMLWAKAQVRLTEPKLKSLYSELKIHDKEELAFKKFRSEGNDKEGIKEAEMRKKLIGIMSTYGLLEHFEDVENPQMAKHHEPYKGKSDKYINKYLFKDKKLNKLWEKAESAGFTAEELQTLKEEFMHHQEKVDEYYSLLNKVEAGDPEKHKNAVEDDLDVFNTLENLEENEMPQHSYHDHLNALRESHKKLRDDYDRLYRLSMKGPNAEEFVEPKVQGLWKMALSGNFTAEELHSLKSELFHYEKRLVKVRNLQVEAALEEEKRKVSGDKERKKHHHEKEFEIKKHMRKLGNLHSDIEAKINSRVHSEL